MTPARLLALSVCGVAPSAAQEHWPPHAQPEVVRADAKLLSGRLRIGGMPGDWAIRAEKATAVVRNSDGYLVDFWPEQVVHSTPQLSKSPAMDGLWMMHPVVHDQGGVINLTAETVRARGSEIETSSTFTVAGARLRVTTHYRVDPKRPRLVITSKFDHIAGDRVVLEPGDLLRWGNVEYYVDGRVVPPTFHGSGRTIGRKGASGDLMLQAGDGSPLRIATQMTHYGIAPAIRARYARARLLPGQSRVVQRVLSYEPLPVHAAPVVPSGTARFSVVDEHAEPLAFKVSLRGRAGTPDPDFGSDGDESGAGRFAWSGNGQLSVALPAGSYQALATAGYERDARSWEFTIAAGQGIELTGTLPRVIETPGIIAADLHLHQAPSVDADISLATRVISVAAEGVELAVPSDHYAVTDLGPSVQSLLQAGHLTRPIATLVGTELSTVGNEFGHFNVFPLTGSGSIEYRDTTPRRLFAEVRAKHPKALIQVNHPRMHDLGYFSRYGLDPASGRLPVRSRSEFSHDFDAIEVFNGMEAWSLPLTRVVLFDWLHLLRHDRRITATGNSDSHKLFYADPGLPRNMIRYGQAATDAQDVAASSDSIMRALRAGNVVVTSGPMLDVDVLGVGPGGTVTTGGLVRPLHVRVRAAPWVDVSDIEVLLGSTGRRLRWINVARSQEVLRYEGIIPVPVTQPTFVVVVVMGRRDLPNVHTRNVKPFAFSNPIWLVP